LIFLHTNCVAASDGLSAEAV